MSSPILIPFSAVLAPAAQKAMRVALEGRRSLNHPFILALPGVGKLALAHFA
jgi:hypothetical protein